MDFKLSQIFDIDSRLTKKPHCLGLEVRNADYADCNGQYEYLPAIRVPWAPDKPVYKRVHTAGRGHVRYIFLTQGKGFGTKWVIGGTTELKTSGSYFHISKTNDIVFNAMENCFEIYSHLHRFEVNH